KNHVRLAQFITGPLALVTNPVYIARSGLLRSIRLMAPEIGGRVMDVGCGTKPYEKLFSRATEYVGVDLAVSGHDHHDSKVDVFYDGKTLPFPSQSFDAVVCFQVLEHVFNIDELIVEMRRVLKPGGLLLVSLPLTWDEHEIPYDFARYTSFGIKHILSKHHFSVLKLEKTTTYFLTVFHMLIAYLHQHVIPKQK